MFWPNKEDDGTEDQNTLEETEKLVSGTSTTAADALSAVDKMEHNQLKQQWQDTRYTVDMATSMTAAAATTAVAEMPLKWEKFTAQESKLRVYENIPHY